jgi:hypothetical protein
MGWGWGRRMRWGWEGLRRVGLTEHSTAQHSTAQHSTAQHLHRHCPPTAPFPKPAGIIEALSKLRGAVQKEQKEEKDIAEKVGGQCSGFRGSGLRVQGFEPQVPSLDCEPWPFQRSLARCDIEARQRARLLRRGPPFANTEGRRAWRWAW